MVLKSLVGVVSLALCLAATGAFARPQRGQSPGGRSRPGGGITHEFLNNTVSCTASVDVSTWATASNEYIKMVLEALSIGCTGDIPKMVEKLETQAEAYAKSAVTSFAQCEATGEQADTWGCATSQGAARAHARAVYGAWVEAYAEAKNSMKSCTCLLETYGTSYASIDYWDELFVKTQVEMKRTLCQAGEGKTTIESAAACYGSAAAWMTVKGIVKAMTDADEFCGGLQRACALKKETTGSCAPQAIIKSQTQAQAILDVDETSLGSCASSYTQVVAETGSDIIHGEGFQSTHLNISKPVDVTVEAECTTEALARANNTAASTFVGAVANALVDTCQAGVAKVDPSTSEQVGKAFAEAYVEATAACSVNDTSGTGAGRSCAVSQAFAESFAEASVKAWGKSYASAIKGDLESTCGCKATGQVISKVESSLKAKLFAEVTAMAAADLWGDDGSECVAEGEEKRSATAGCLASAMAAVWSQVSASALLEGHCIVKDGGACRACCKGPGCKCEAGWKEKCITEKGLRASAYADAMVGASVELNEGYCTGVNKGGFYKFDSGAGAYKCYKGCKAAAPGAAH